MTAAPDSALLPTRRAEFWAGFRATIPLVVGAIPFGIIFGALAVSAGPGEESLSPLATLVMSLAVFAGSSQFIAAGLVAGGAGGLVIVLITFVVNLRHMLYGATLAPFMKRLPQTWLLPLAFWMTDESFVIAATHYQKPDPSPYKHWFFLGSAVFMYTNWQLCTLIGILLGQAIPAEDVRRLGLDFAGMVTFIGMLIPLVRSRAALLGVIAAGGASLLLNGLPYKLGLIAAALIGVVVAMIAEQTLRHERGGAL